MLQKRDREYFAEREATERTAAKAAKSPEAKAIHLRLADHYAVLRAHAKEFDDGDVGGSVKRIA